MGCEGRTVFYFLVLLFLTYFIYFLVRAIKTLLTEKNRPVSFRFSRTDWYNAIAVFFGCSIVCALLIMVAAKYIPDGLHPSYYLLTIPLALVSVLIHKILN